MEPWPSSLVAVSEPPMASARRRLIESPSPVPLAIAPLVFGAIIDRRGGVDAGPRAWGWAFASLGVGGLLALASVTMLHRLAEARALTRGFRATR